MHLKQYPQRVLSHSFMQAHIPVVVNQTLTSYLNTEIQATRTHASTKLQRIATQNYTQPNVTLQRTGISYPRTLRLCSIQQQSVKTHNLNLRNNKHTKTQLLSIHQAQASNLIITTYKQPSTRNIPPMYNIKPKANKQAHHTTKQLTHQKLNRPNIISMQVPSSDAYKIAESSANPKKRKLHKPKPPELPITNYKTNANVRIFDPQITCKCLAANHKQHAHAIMSTLPTTRNNGTPNPAATIISTEQPPRLTNHSNFSTKNPANIRWSIQIAATKISKQQANPNSHSNINTTTYKHHATPKSARKRPDKPTLPMNALVSSRTISYNPYIYRYTKNSNSNEISTIPRYRSKRIITPTSINMSNKLHILNPSTLQRHLQNENQTAHTKTRPATPTKTGTIVHLTHPVTGNLLNARPPLSGFLNPGNMTVFTVHTQQNYTPNPLVR
eukprot:gene13146-8992_t